MMCKNIATIVLKWLKKELNSREKTLKGSNGKELA